MAISSDELVGYQKAEFAKASRWRLTLLFVQFCATIPAALSVIVTDEKLLYALAVIGPVLLIVWWIARAIYQRARGAAHAARRAGLITGGLGTDLSPEEHQRLRHKFTVEQSQAAAKVDPDYYASTLPVSSARLGEMLEESAFYSADIHRASAGVMQAIFIFFIVLALLVALASAPFAERVTVITGIKVVLAATVFLLSSDVLGAATEHREAARGAEEVRTRMVAADARQYPDGDVLLAMADYNNAMEGAPEAVPGVYRSREKKLNERWAEYKADRDAIRAAKRANP